MEVKDLKIKDLIINPEFYNEFERMLEEIKFEGETGHCPDWQKSLIELPTFNSIPIDRKTKCEVCFHFFPECNRWDCPCFKHHEEVLIPFLETVLKQSCKVSD